jgi:hypothetical protein
MVLARCVQAYLKLQNTSSGSWKFAFHTGALWVSDDQHESERGYRANSRMVIKSRTSGIVAKARPNISELVSRLEEALGVLSKIA